MNSNRRLVVIVGLLVISIYTAHVRRTRARTILPRKDYFVVCLPKDADLKTAYQKLRAYYDIAHTPAEGGRCYFKFTNNNDVACSSPRVAARKGLKDFPSYPGNSGKSCYFLAPELIELIDALKTTPAISRTKYNGIVVKNWEQVREKLSP